MYYTKPQYRIPPFAVGMLTAMLWHIKIHHYPRYKLPQVPLQRDAKASCFF
jgi:hypothetical protein